MFTYKNNRVHVAGLSFVIPDGCILNWMNTEVEIDGFSALTPDRKVKFYLLPQIYTGYSDKPNAMERIKDSFSVYNDRTNPYTFHTDITPIHKYGLDGYSLSYSSESVHYYDECFDLPEQINGIYQIEVLLSASGGVTLEDALQNPIVKEFMDSLRKNKGNKYPLI